MKIYDTINDLYERFWSEQPLVKSAFFLSLSVAGIKIIQENSTSSMKDIFSGANTQIIIGSAVLVQFFILAAVFYYEKLQSERMLRRQEEAFKYDKRGTLYNGSEPNIAFRVATFQGILKCIADTFGSAPTQTALLDAGANASEDFAQNLPRIFDGDVQHYRGGPVWSQLSFREKLQQWADYDSATGWGIMSIKWDEPNDIVVVSVSHQRSLLEGPGGHLFAYFLAGYCKTVLTAIIKNHDSGKPGDFVEADIANIDPRDDRVKIRIQS